MRVSVDRALTLQEGSAQGPCASAAALQAPGQSGSFLRCLGCVYEGSGGGTKAKKADALGLKEISGSELSLLELRTQTLPTASLSICPCGEVT